MDKKSDNLSRNSLGHATIFGILIGVFLTVVSAYAFEFVYSEAFWIKIKSDAPTVLALIVAFVSLIISYRMFTEQRRARQAGTDPVILVHLGSREDARVLSTLEISNVGAGAALSVKVELLSDLSQFFPHRIMTDFNELEQIQAIPQGSSVSYNFGLGFKLLDAPAIPPINFRVSYEDIEGTSHQNIQVINVSQLNGQRADEGLQSRIAKSLEKIEKAAAAGFPSNEARHVIVQPLSEDREEQADHIRVTREFVEKQSKS